MNIKSTRQGNSIFDEMKSRTFELHMMERQSAYAAYTSGDELVDALEVSEDAYNFNLSKLDDLSDLSNRHEIIRRRFIEQKIYIDQMDMSEKNKIETILTSASILENFGIIIINRKASNEDFYLLARAMLLVAPSEYSLYQTLIVSQFDNLVRMLKNFSDSPIERAKQYVKTENN